MTRLVDLAEVLRSKNAGPFQVTLDVFLPDAATYRRVVDSGVLSSESVARLYAIPEDTVTSYFLPDLRAVKITYDRPGGSSGSFADRDVYGAQQHGPLLRVEVA